VDEKLVRLTLYRPTSICMIDMVHRGKAGLNETALVTLR